MNTNRTEAENALIEHVLGANYANKQSYENFIHAATLNVSREVSIEMLQSFDEYTDSQGIKYFLLGGTLKGVISYKDFMPDSDKVEIGMLRTDFEMLENSFENLASDDVDGLPWDLSVYQNNKLSKVRRLHPRLCSKQPREVVFEGECVFNKQSLPITVNPYIEIYIFDEVPNDFFTRKKFFRQMKRRNDLVKRIVYARRVLFGKRVSPFEDQDNLVISHRRIRKLFYALVPLRFAVFLNWTLAKRYKGRDLQNVTGCMYARTKTVPLSDLGDMPKRDFCGISVRTPARPDIWATEPVLETTEELARLQNDAKTIVSEIDRICSLLNINYFACGGTMLGYVRHGGFIPWDDDIDVGMLRADYKRFMEEAPKYIDNEKFFLQNRKTDPNIPYLFSKIRLNGSEYLTEYNLNRDFHKGICVDIFPFDYIPNDCSEQIAFKAEVRKAERRHNRVVNRQYPELFQESQPKKKNLDWVLGQFIGRCLARHYWSVSLDETQKKYDEVVERFNDKATEEGLKWVASFVPSYTMAKVDDLYPAQRVNFDEIEICLPKHPKKFLRMQYGDYMELPYPHQRTGHDLLLWSDPDGAGGGRFVDADPEE